MSHLVDLVLAQCERTPEAVALRWWGSTTGRERRTPVEVTYRSLARQVEATATGLSRHGLRPGGRVLFSVRPRPEGVVLALGVVRARGAVVFVDPGSTPELFAARLAAAAPTMAATESLLHALATGPLRGVARRRGLLLPRWAQLDLQHLHTGPRLPGVPRGSVRAAALARPAAAATGSWQVDGTDGQGAGHAEDEALVVFTSGTTDAPRAVVHTAGSLAAATELLGAVHRLEPGEEVHTDQMLLGLPALLSGATWSIPARAPAQDVVSFAARAADAASTYLVPADVTALLDAVEAGRAPARSARRVLVGGAPVTAALLARAVRVLPETRWTGVYGMTEILPVAVVEAEEKLAHTGEGDLVGRVLPGVEVRIDGEELVLSGPSLMRGYLGASPVTEHRSGDLARVQDGRLVLVGRARDMIIRGTVNIYPGLHEPRLARLPGVRAAALVGVPQEDGDERVVLVVEGDRTTADALPSARTPLTSAVTHQLPEVLDHGALPDAVVQVGRMPVAGRSRKPDRRALVTLVQPLLGPEQGR
ncbi:acyl--CoA ligase [Actinotalea sp. BY-33]|uniref:Acyl--CoA ligase n=1 Tax=Actinotalea soli TaxID=2819234 RepID=A0A939LNS5_9CELL|nr:class I adenylate-forming enzyme family protein [Actinotalea soli]MBO1750798.1 acyl--CoA ligase [Actinotalea soli]